METHLPQDQEMQLNEFAATRGRGTGDLVQEVDQIAGGEFVDEEEMDARLKRMLA